MPANAPAARLLAWPFRSRRSSLLWLAVRLYLGSVWLQFGVGKLRSGWITTNPMGSLLGAVADGHTSAPFGAFRPVAWLLLDLGADPALSVLIPLAEVALGIAFVAGVLLVPASVAATLLNLSLILAGIASVRFDGRMVMLQLLLLAAWPVAGHVGAGMAARRFRRRAAPDARPQPAARSPSRLRHPRAT